jgi:hypothetical protein
LRFLYFSVLTIRLVLVFNHAGQHIGNAQVKSGRLELDLFPHELCPFIACRVNPAYEIEMVYL